MLPWWGWLVFWVVLLLGSAAWIGLRARDVWRRVNVLGGEVERASELVAALEARVDELAEVDPPRTAATQPPHRMRAEHREQRAQQVADRRLRRARRLPPWARVE